jgi:hypothetical protein
MRFARGGRGRWRVRSVPLAVLAVILAGLVIWTVHEARKPGPWQRIIRASDQFVALPHRSALRRDVEIRYGGRALVVPVMDVGPWNTDDDYWSTGLRPAAERGRGTFRTPANRAGIDLSDATFALLGLRDNDWVEWRFVHRGYVALPRVASGW